MSIVNNNTKITAPVSTDDVSQILSVASHDVATLCSSGKINPASKCKPIRVDQPESLTDAQRMGNGTDGLYYGVRVKQNGTGLYNIDSSGMYEYVGVRAGVDWARLDDFVGYVHTARFNPSALVSESFLLDSEPGCGVSIAYSEYSDPDKTPGIDVSYIARQFTAGTDLGEHYPCAMVRVGNAKYIRALWNSHYEGYMDEGNVEGFTTLKHGGVIYRYWRVMPAPSSWNLNTGDTVYVTIFFISRIYANQWNIRSRWLQVTQGTLCLYTLWGCPDGIAVPVKVKAYVTKGMAVTRVSGLRGGATFTAVWDWLSDAETGVEYIMSVTITTESGLQVGTGSVRETYTGAPAPVLGTSITARNIVGGIAAGTYHYTFTVKSSQSGTQTCNVGSGVFTVS